MPTKQLKSQYPPDQLALQFELPLFPPEITAAPPAAAPAAPSATQKRRSIQLGPQRLEYTLRRSRRKSIGFSIGDDGLAVSAPKWVNLSQIEDAIREKQRWIFAKTLEMRERRMAIPRVKWGHGGLVPYLGQPLTLVIPGVARAGPDAVSYDPVNSTLTVAVPAPASEQQIKDHVQGWLQAEVRRIFAERLDLYAQRLGVRYRVFNLSSASTRWGSCSSDGKILLNWRLIHFPMSSIDYVVAHELAHLREMNHGPRFWRTVAEVLPGFESARAHLKDPPGNLLPVL